jgi:3-hydroxyacyl-CoA dehydrogenase
MEKGFHLLTSLCTDEQGSLALLAADGIDLVLDAMKEYEESFAVQKAAFAVISNICSSAIIANSTEQIVINVLHAINKFDQSFLLLKEEGCRALWGLLSIENNLEKTWEMST